MIKKRFKIYNNIIDYNKYSILEILEGIFEKHICDFTDEKLAHMVCDLLNENHEKTNA